MLNYIIHKEVKMKAYKIITKIVLPAALASTLLVGCRNVYWHKEGDFRGYAAKAGVDETGRKVILIDKNDANRRIIGTDEDKNGTIDKIIFRNIDLNHPLNQYAPRDSLEVAYSTITGK